MLCLVTESKILIFDVLICVSLDITFPYIPCLLSLANGAAYTDAQDQKTNKTSLEGESDSSLDPHPLVASDRAGFVKGCVCKPHSKTCRWSWTGRCERCGSDAGAEPGSHCGNHW
jgi:hypothetical protein